MKSNIIALKNDIENIINKYQCQISFFLPKPHADFVNSEKGNFFVKNFSCDSDSEIEWTYYYNTNNPGGYVLGHSTVILSLQNDIMPAIKSLIELPPKKEKRKETVKNVASLALFIMGSELSFGNDIDEISNESKQELTDIVHKYEAILVQQRCKVEIQKFFRVVYGNYYA